MARSLVHAMTVAALGDRYARHVLGDVLFEQFGRRRVVDHTPQKRWVDRVWSGQALVSGADLRKAVGPRAFKAWCILCEVRDGSRDAQVTGMIYSGAGWLARRLHCSVSAAERAVARLTAAHLVRPLEDPWRMVRQKGGALVLCYQRRVYGNPKPDFQGDVHVLPTTRKWLESKPKRGGARAGAGRKPNSKPRDPEFKAEDNLPTGEQEQSNTLTGVDNRAASCAVDPNLKSRAGGANVADQPAPTSTHTSAPQEVPGRAAVGSAPTPAPDTVLPKAELLAASGASVDEVVARLFHAVPHPGWHVAPPAVVPNPPKLPDDMPDARMVDRLVQAFRGAVEKITGKDPMVFAKRGSVEQAKGYRDLVQAAVMLRDNKIAPVAWAWWSCRVWRSYGVGKAAAPPLSWVLSCARIAEHRGWFEQEGGNDVGGTIVRAPAARELGDRYRSMRLQMTWATSVEQMQEIADRHFPVGVYDALVAKAREQTAETQASLDRAVANGVWIW